MKYRLLCCTAVNALFLGSKLPAFALPTKRRDVPARLRKGERSESSQRVQSLYSQGPKAPLVHWSNEHKYGTEGAAVSNLPAWFLLYLSDGIAQVLQLVMDCLQFLPHIFFCVRQNRKLGVETPKDFLHPVRARNVSELISLVPSPAQTPAAWCFGHVSKSQGFHLPLALVLGGISEHGAGSDWACRQITPSPSTGNVRSPVL